MNQIFAEKLYAAGRDRPSLVALMNQIDEQKRSLRIVLRRMAQDPEYKISGHERQNKERKIKDKERYLIEEREAVRQRIIEVNRDEKAINRATNRKKGFTVAFLAAAEQILDQELLMRIELKAAEMLSDT